MQDKLGRMLALTCLNQVIGANLVRCAASGSTEDTTKWLSKVTKPVLQGVRKGYFQFPEQQVGKGSNPRPGNSLVLMCFCPLFR